MTEMDRRNVESKLGKEASFMESRDREAYLFLFRQQADAAPLWRWSVLGSRIPTFVDELLFNLFPILCLVTVWCLEIKVAEASFDACFRIVLIRDLLSSLVSNCLL